MTGPLYPPCLPPSLPSIPHGDLPPFLASHFGAISRLRKHRRTDPPLALRARANLVDLVSYFLPSRSVFYSRRLPWSVSKTVRLHTPTRHGFFSPPRREFKADRFVGRAQTRSALAARGERFRIRSRARCVLRLSTNDTLTERGR